MNTARYVIAVLTVSFLPPALVWWFIVHPFVGFWRARGPKMTLGVMAVFSVLSIAGLMSIRGTLVGADLGTSIPSLIVAAILLTVSIVIALKRRKHLTQRILAGIPELSQEGERGELLTEGIYSRIRHPRYVEVAIGTLAYAAFANYVGAYIVAFATIPLLHLIVLVEERELRDRFGSAYVEYAARVPRYLPKRPA